MTSTSCRGRPLDPMPDPVRTALEARGLLAAYHKRPPNQQNDYLGWIARAKTESTREKSLGQMLTELAAGDRYMRMAWRPGSRQAAGQR